MGFRFRKSIKIAPGVKLNLNRKSVGVSIGTRGAHYTVNSKGRKTASVGIPGTGISYTKTSKQTPERSSNTFSEPSPNRSAPNGKRPDNQKWFQNSTAIILLLIFFFPVGLFLMWKYSNWKKSIKCVITVVIIIGVISVVKDRTEKPSEANKYMVETETAQTEAPQTEVLQTEVPKTEASKVSEATPIETQSVEETTRQTEQIIKVWTIDGSNKYHSDQDCSGMIDAYQITLEEAQNAGEVPCGRCY